MKKEFNLRKATKNEMEQVKEKPLSEKLKELFEIEYLDTMADVQGDVHVLFAEAVKKLKEYINMAKGSKLMINEELMLEKIDKIMGEFK